MKAIRIAAVLAAAGLAGCGDDGDDGAAHQILDDGDWRGPGVSADGGPAEGAGGTGGPGGAVRVSTLRGIAQDAAAPAPPAPPPGGQALSDADLSADVTRSGTLRIEGTVTTSGPGAVRTITSTDGDIVIAGTLRAADPGGAVQGLTLQAPRGTVYVTGTIQAENFDGAADGDAGGAIVLRGSRVVVTGSLRADGEDGTSQGGDGGRILLAAPGPVYVGGRVSARGGSVLGGSGDGARGGNGGVLEVTASGEIVFSAAAVLRGGWRARPERGRRAGKAAGFSSRVSRSCVFPERRIFGAGAPKRAAERPPAAGEASGRPGWEAPWTVSRRRRARFRLRGAGGTIAALCDVGGGALTCAAALRARGGSASDPSRSTPGGSGGSVELEAASSSGSVTLRAGSSAVADGGESAGAAVAGEGGKIEIVLADGPVSVAGEVRARGGAARGAGGTSGRGGFFGVRSDNDGDGTGGDITIEAGALVDVSGGPGDVGGSARNNGGPGVGHIPDRRGVLAVVLDSDSVSGSPVGAVIRNLGRVVARGAARNGSGGDVMFHGAGPDGRRDPLPGDVDLAGDGAGAPGDFAAE